MADLDSDLSRRLSRLADAVPTARLDPVHLRAVEARHRVRMAWMTPLVALVVIVVGSTLIGGRGHPGATSGPGVSTPAGPVAATTRSGDFELTIRAEKGRYEAGDAIGIEASLEYLGQDPVDIRHAQGARVPGRGIVDGPDTGGTGGPIGFGIVEPVLGDLNLGPTWAESCELTALEPGAVLRVPFSKAAGWSGDDPRSDEYEAYFWDPVLRLTAGTWHVYAVAEFSIGQCGAAQIKMRVDLTIEVVPGPPAPAEGSAGAGPATLDRDGPFSLELRAGKARYAPNEAIDVVSTLLFDGPGESIEFQHDSSGPIMFGIRERVFGEIDVGGISILMFDQTTLQRSVPYVKSFVKSGGIGGNHPDEAMFRSWMEDPVLRLPEGTWHLYAVAGGSMLDGDSVTGGFSLSAEVEIVVDDDPAATPGHPAATEYPYKPVYGGADIGSVVLQLKSERPIYAAGAPIELSVDYWFADGPRLNASHFYPEVGWSLVQLDATDPEARFTVYDSLCVDLGLVTGMERHIEIGPRLIAAVRGDALPELNDELFVDGSLRLPVGRWRISASVAGTFGPCSGGGEPYELDASLEIEVVERLG